MPGAGAIIAGPVTNSPVAVSNGLLTMALDFGTPTHSNSNVPMARGLHAAAWTGTEMVVHGSYYLDFPSGTISLTTFFDDAWRYTPPRTMFPYLKP